VLLVRRLTRVDDSMSKQAKATAVELMSADEILAELAGKASSAAMASTGTAGWSTYSPRSARS
jgi:hypothetical protein